MTKEDKEKINYASFIVSPPVKDHIGQYIFRFVFNFKGKSHLLVKNLEPNDETRPFYNYHINTENITIEDLYNMAEDENIIQLIKSLINGVINPLNIPAIEPETQEIYEFLINNLYELADEEARTERIKEIENALNDDDFKNAILQINGNITEQLKNEKEETKKLDFIELKAGLETLTSEKKHGRMLANYLNVYENVILSRNVNAPYKLNEKNGCYMPLNLDDLYIITGDLFGKNLISKSHFDVCLTTITERIWPTANTVQFKNCLYSMLEHKPIKTDKKIICSVVSPFNYDPEAPSKAKGIINDFLMSSMHKPDPEDPSNEAKAKEYTRKRVQGLKEIIGYSFTSGNKYNILPVVVGISGGGKSVLGSIIKEIFNKTTCDVPLQAMGIKDIEKQAKACEPLAHSYINLVQDSSDAPIYDNSIIKKATGNDSIAFKKLYKDVSMLQPQEIPKTWLICNILPEFKNLELAIIERLFIIDFLVKFRGTDKQDPDLLDKILNQGKYKGEYPHEIEAFIFECLEAYSQKEESGADFLLKPTEDETKALYLKFQSPMDYLINKLILKFDPLADSEAEDYEEGRNKTLDNYITVDELKEALSILETKEGVNLKRNSKDEIMTKDITASLFDIVDGVEEYTDERGRKYTPKRKRIGDERVYIYPDLVKDPDTWEIVENEKEKQDK